MKALPRGVKALLHPTLPTIQSNKIGYVHPGTAQFDDLIGGFQHAMEYSTLEARINAYV